MSIFSSPKVRNVLIVAVVALVLVIYVAAIAGVGLFQNTLSTNTTYTALLHYPITINYTGSWNLVYWGTNGTIMPSNHTNYNVRGNLNGSGNYETTVVTYRVGPGLNTFCAEATKLGSQNNLTLILTIFNGPDALTNSTTASSPSAKVCATFGVQSGSVFDMVRPHNPRIPGSLFA